MTAPKPIFDVTEGTPLLDSINSPADLRRIEASKLQQVADELRALDLDRITPVDALTTLAAIKAKLKKE